LTATGAKLKYLYNVGTKRASKRRQKCFSIDGVIYNYINS